MSGYPFPGPPVPPGTAAPPAMATVVHHYLYHLPPGAAPPPPPAGQEALTGQAFAPYAVPSHHPFHSYHAAPPMTTAMPAYAPQPQPLLPPTASGGSTAPHYHPQMQLYLYHQHHAHIPPTAQHAFHAHHAFAMQPVPVGTAAPLPVVTPSPSPAVMGLPPAIVVVPAAAAANAANATGTAAAESDAGAPAVERSTTQLIVNYLDNEVTGPELLRIFSRAGQVESARVMYDPRTNQPLGYGFVYFENPEDARRAVATLNRFPLRRKRLRVTFANRLRHERGLPQQQPTHAPPNHRPSWSDPSSGDALVRAAVPASGSLVPLVDDASPDTWQQLQGEAGGPSVTSDPASV